MRVVVVAVVVAVAVVNVVAVVVDFMTTIKSENFQFIESSRTNLLLFESTAYY